MTDLKTLQPCASARAVVGYWGKCRGTAYQPAMQSLLHSLKESQQAQKGDNTLIREDLLAVLCGMHQFHRIGDRHRMDVQPDHNHC